MMEIISITAVPNFMRRPSIFAEAAGGNAQLDFLLNSRPLSGELLDPDMAGNFV